MSRSGGRTYLVYMWPGLREFTLIRFDPSSQARLRVIWRIADFEVLYEIQR